MSSDRDARMPPPAMSRAEREELHRLIRHREKVLKSAAKQRSKELFADFMNQMGQQYSFDQDEVWAKAKAAVEREVKKAQAAVHARCRELGIPDQFAPGIDMVWHHRGYGNILAQRGAELQAMAVSQIAAIEAQAITQIEMSCLEAQTQLAMAGLTSEAAKEFLASIPPIESLMPKLSFAAIAGEANPPIAKQLVSANALRQRRFRERQRALKGG